MDAITLLVIGVVLAVLGIALINTGLESTGKRGDVLFYSGIICVLLALILFLIAFVIACAKHYGKGSDGVIIIPIPIYIP